MAFVVNHARLKSERRRRGWSQEDLAAASGISTRTVQRLERGGSATISSIAALTATLALSLNALTISTETVRRITPLTILRDITSILDRFRRMGCKVKETDHPSCIGVAAGSSYQLLCSEDFMLLNYPPEVISALIGQTIPYIWVTSVQACERLWERAVHPVHAMHDTREVLVEADGAWAILAETFD